MPSEVEEMVLRPWERTASGPGMRRSHMDLTSRWLERMWSTKEEKGREGKEHRV
jgi:hypothetical protein